jgi:glycosyltransferase involved in cell wall biosynthesis
LQALSDEVQRQSVLEVLVVLNDCSDDSTSVVDRFAERLPIRKVTEPTPGIANARNRAADEAKGDMILSVDDDVRVRPGWFDAYREAFRRWPDAGFFGGPIRPDLEEPSPAWLRTTLPDLGVMFAERDCTNLGGSRIEKGYTPFGANYAVRAGVQRRYRFDPRFGRFPGWLRGGEETKVVEAMLADGVEGRWVENAVVDHWIPRERQTLAYMRAYYSGAGRTRVLDFSPENDSGRIAAFLHSSGRVAALECHYLVSRLLFGPTRWVPKSRDAALTRGEWRGRYWPDFGRGR